MNIESPNKKYQTEKSLVYSCQYHVIWTTKYRRKVLVPPLDERIKELILEKQIAYALDTLSFYFFCRSRHSRSR